MKNITIWLITLFAFLCGGALTAQQAKIIDLGLFKNPADHKKLEIKLRPAQDVENWSHSAGIFTVRVPSEYGVTLTEVPGSSPYGYSFAGPVGQFEGYDYYRYQFSGSVHFVTWEKGRQYPVLTLQVQGDPPRNARYELVTGNEWTRRHNGDYYQELAGQELERTFYYLPLRMMAFHAEPLPDRTVQLNWELETEELLSHSEVEYSVDGRDFDPDRHGACKRRSRSARSSVLARACQADKCQFLPDPHGRYQRRSHLFAGAGHQFRRYRC
jgi:hypothetical protein